MEYWYLFDKPGRDQILPGERRRFMCYCPQKGLHLNINSLTAVLFGYKRPKELYDLELIKGDLEEVKHLEKIIPLFKPFFYDFF